MNELIYDNALECVAQQYVNALVAGGSNWTATQYLINPQRTDMYAACLNGSYVLEIRVHSFPFLSHHFCLVTLSSLSLPALCTRGVVIVLVCCTRAHLHNM